MLKLGILSAAIAAWALGPGVARSADFADPTWPCMQRKVERLSPALMWQYPLPEAEPGGEIASEIKALAEKLALRRIETESLRPDVESFARAHEGDPDALGHVFARTFDLLDRRRTRVIDGIGKFSLGQIKLSESIDATRLEMDRLMQQDAPDYDRIDALEVKLDWDQVIYSDRNQSITYLCETPQLIERRLYAIAQLLAGEVRAPE